MRIQSFAMAIAALISGVVLGLTPSLISYAGHGAPATSQYHLATIHWNSSSHGALDEDFCYEGYGSISHNDYKGLLQTALIINSGSWDGTGSYNIDLWATGSHCSDYTPDNPQIELWYSIQPYGCGTSTEIYSCLSYRFNSILDPGFSTYHSTGAVIIIAQPHLQGFPDSIISHETGHAFGLLDPLGPPNPDCGWPDNWYYGSSVMHQYQYYGCPATPYINGPTSYDKDTVVNGEMISH